MPLGRRIRKRLGEIASYAALAASPADAVNLAVLGLARGHPFNSDDLLSRLGRFFYPTISLRPASLGGLRLVLDSSDVSQMVVFEEVIRDALYDLSLIPFPPDAIVDCGAHIGLFTLKAQRAFPGVRLTAFEPNPANLRLLRAQRKTNYLAFEIVAAAVSLTDGEAWFHEICSSGGALASERPRNGPAYQVPVVDLRRWLARRAPRRLLLKLDVEGEERTLLPGIVPYLPGHCALFFESHDGAEGYRRLADVLTGGGFRVKQLTERLPYIDGFAIRT
jgi:FkbM family methyltransferase